jgi:hypothetical protein
MDAVASFEYHDNHVYLQVRSSQVKTQIDNSGFSVAAFSISPGQDPKNKNKVGDPKYFQSATPSE